MNILKNSKQIYTDNRQYRDMRDLINSSATHYGNNVAFVVKHKKNRKEFNYEEITYNRFRDETIYFGTALLKEGHAGKRIAIIGKNRYEWMIAYFSTLSGVGTCVPLDKGLPYEEVESSLIRSKSEVLVFDKEHLPQIERMKAEGNVPTTTFICMDEIEGYKSINEYMAEGKEAFEAGYDEYTKLPIDINEVNLLLFTSGTTSMAKAVMLSPRNLMSNLEALDKVVKVYPTDVSMAFLPYHHTFGSMGQLVMLSRGVKSAFCDGLRYLQQNLVEYKVSVFFCVPLLIESVYKKVMATVEKEGKAGKVAFGMKLTGILGKFGIDIRRKVFKEVLDKLGGDIRFVISGAAAIDPEALKGFRAFGIDAIQGYGMTEASPVITCETLKENKVGSIGKPLPGVDVAIFEPNEEGVGELIARGENVMHGYYENEEETANVLVDGWLHTGDLAYEEDGYIFICGRKKSVIVLKNGKNVYPEELEVLINNLPYVAESMVFGQPKNGDERDPALAVKIVYNPEYMKSTYNTEDPDEIQKIVKADVDKINDQLPTYKQMARIITTDQEMIKTTTGKVKRFEEIKRTV